MKPINDTITKDKVNALLNKYKYETLAGESDYNPEPVTNAVCDLPLFTELIYVIAALAKGKGTVALSSMFVLGMQMGYELAETAVMEETFGDTK